MACLPAKTEPVALAQRITIYGKQSCVKSRANARQTDRAIWESRRCWCVEMGRETFSNWVPSHGAGKEKWSGTLGITSLLVRRNEERDIFKLGAVPRSGERKMV